MAAVIGPVGVQNTDLRHGGIPVLFFPVIRLNMKKVLKGHGQVQAVIKGFERALLHGGKARKCLYILRNRKFHRQGLRLFLSCLPAVHGIDAEALDGRFLLRCQRCGDHVGGSRADHRLLLCPQKLHALFRRVRPLVKLPRQILHGKYHIPRILGELLFIYQIHRRLGKDGSQGLAVGLLGQIFHIVADQHPHALHMADSQVLLQLLFQLPGLHGKLRLLLHKDSSYTHLTSSWYSPNNLHGLLYTAFSISQEI